MVNSHNVAEDLQQKYASQGAYPVEADVEAIEAMGIKTFKADVMSETDWVRHDPLKLSRTIVSMIYKLKANSERMRLLDRPRFLSRPDAEPISASASGCALAACAVCAISCLSGQTASADGDFGD